MAAEMLAVVVVTEVVTAAMLVVGVVLPLMVVAKRADHAECHPFWLEAAQWQSAFHLVTPHLLPGILRLLHTDSFEL